MTRLQESVSDPRLLQIEHARRAVFSAVVPVDGGRTERRRTQSLLHSAEGHWIERSWRRCLAAGLRPEQRVAFDVITEQAARRTNEAHHELLQAATPALSGLARATAGTRYFAMLTDANGVVVGVDGLIDASDPRVSAIARVGVDLSERSIGTSAISAALSEHQPVWLHRGEHFFDDTAIYSCAGAPIFGPTGDCVGMLDLTGVEVTERPELKHLVAQSARSVENALTLRQPRKLLVRLNWPGQPSSDSDGLLCLDADGQVTAANQSARQMLSGLARVSSALHADELFAMPYQLLFDAARRMSSSGSNAVIELPLWSGLRIQARMELSGQIAVSMGVSDTAQRGALPLKDIEMALVREAVATARGNVAEAARALGISRATVYRKLGKKGA